jgi:hypothetical protein
VKIEIYRHNHVSEIDFLPSAKSIICCLEKLAFQCNRNTARELREEILGMLMTDGWSNSVKIAGNTNITITSVRDKTGLCLQTGNMARFYADFLKLQLLYKNGVIDDAVYCVLSKETAVNMGSNLANFDRVVQELKLFKEIVTVPMYILGMSAE